MVKTMKTKLTILLLSFTTLLLNACSSPIPRKIIIGDIEMSLLAGLLFAVLLGAALFFIFVWPPHNSDKTKKQQDMESR